MTRRLLGAGALLVALGLGGLPAAGEDKKATGADAKGWAQLFNGKDLTGWKIHPDPNPREIKQIVAVEKDGKVVAYDGKLAKQEKAVHLWRVEDGLLIGSGPSTHLFSDRGDYA